MEIVTFAIITISIFPIISTNTNGILGTRKNNPSRNLDKDFKTCS